MPGPPLLLASQKLSGLSGKVILVRENARALAALGCPVTVAAQRLDAETFRAPGVRLARVGRPPGGKAVETWWFTRRVAALARRAGALVVGHGESLLAQDVLHVHNAVHRAHEALGGAPWSPSDEPPFARVQRRILFERRFRAIVANSRLVRDDLVARWGIDPSVVTVVYPGHDPARFRPDPGDERPRALRRELGAGADDLVVGLVTSGAFEKRAVGPFVEALAGLPRPLRDRVVCLVVGREPHPERYLAPAREAGLGGRVHLLPPRPDVEVLYRALDLYVHPAPFEEFGMSVLEAMATGVPVLTNAGVGASELLESAEVLRTPDVASLRAGIAALCTDADRRAHLSQTGRAAAARATWERNVAAHAEVYARVAQEAHRA